MFTVDISWFLSNVPSGKFEVLMMVVCMFRVYTLTVNVLLFPVAVRQIRIMLVCFPPDGLLVWGTSVEFVSS